MPTAADRTVVNSLLVKLGVETPDKLTGDRATTKLTHRLTKNGVPADLSPEEAALVAELGFAKGATAPPATATAPAGATGDPDLVPVDAAMGTVKGKGKKNAKAAKAATKPTPAAGAKDKGSKAAAKAAPAKAAPAAAAKVKGAKPAPAAKVKGPKVARPGSAVAVFKELLGGGGAVPKATVIDRLVKAGVSTGTAGSYIVWAKHLLGVIGPDNLPRNPFGFRIAETRNDKDVKILQKTLSKK